jgi:hypothetical protein
MKCHKTKYTSQKEAKNDIDRIIKRNDLKIDLYSYLCTNCGSWHISKLKPFELNYDKLNNENAVLKLQVKELQKNIKHNIKIDSEILLLNKRIDNYKKVIDRQKVNINILINENLKLKK